MLVVIVVGDLEQERIEDLAERGEVIVRWLADDFGEGRGCGGKRCGDFLRFHRGWGRVCGRRWKGLWRRCGGGLP